VDSSTGYARSGDAHIGYTVEGTGPLDLLYASTFTISIDSYDEEPHAAHYRRRLAAIGRLIRFDARGVGMSDPIDTAHPPTVEGSARDIEAVLDACNIDRAVVVAEAGGGIGAIEFAATRPERVAALVFVSGFARLIADVGYPFGHPRDLVERFLEQNMDPDEDWTEAGADDVALIAPSMRDDPQFRDWWVRASRRGASPASARAIIGLVSRADVRDRLPEIKAPTLVLHRSENLFVPVGLGRFVGEHIPGARFVALPGADHAPFTGDADEIVDEIEEFLTGTRHVHEPDRMLATVMFTDIVDSTARASELGDTGWRKLLEEHDALMRRELERHRGREVKTMGDGFLATFDGPARGIRCARSATEAVRELGIEIRAGLHTGEVEVMGDDIGGIAVNIGARVGSTAGPGEVLVSRTVTDLVAGSGIDFRDRGTHTLKGVPGEWQLYSVAA
jgi:class 3 adenylate cyclase